MRSINLEEELVMRMRAWGTRTYTQEQDGKKQRKDTKSEFVAKQFVTTIFIAVFNLVWTCSGSS